MAGEEGWANPQGHQQLSSPLTVPAVQSWAHPRAWPRSVGEMDAASIFTSTALPARASSTVPAPRLPVAQGGGEGSGRRKRQTADEKKRRGKNGQGSASGLLSLWAGKQSLVLRETPRQCVASAHDMAGGGQSRRRGRSPGHAQPAQWCRGCVRVWQALPTALRSTHKRSMVARAPHRAGRIHTHCAPENRSGVAEAGELDGLCGHRHEAPTNRGWVHGKKGDNEKNNETPALAGRDKSWHTTVPTPNSMVRSTVLSVQPASDSLP
jgi:hypothetical protein